jgi:hypothetical protein
MTYSNAREIADFGVMSLLALPFLSAEVDGQLAVAR